MPRAQSCPGAAVNQFLDHLAVTVGASGLIDGLVIRGEAEPGEASEEDVDVLLGRTLAVGVLDADQELAAAPLRVKIVEKRRSCAAYVQRAGRRGGETGDDGGMGGR